MAPPNSGPDVSAQSPPSSAGPESAIRRLLNHSLVFRGFLIAAVAATIGALVPGGIAYRNSVFYRSSFLQKIKEVPDDKKSPWIMQVIAFEDQKDARHEGRDNLEAAVLGGNKDRAADLAQIDAEIHSEPEVLGAFYGSLFGPLWFWTFLVMGSLLFIFPPASIPWSKTGDELTKWRTILERLRRKRCGWIFFTGVGICVFYKWPTLCRAWAEPQNTDYPPHPLFYYSPSACIPSFCWEMILELAYSVMLAVLLNWFLHYKRAVQRMDLFSCDDPNRDYVKALTDPAIALTLVAMFEEWLVVSALFASSYLFDAIFYWHQVTSPTGSAYIVSALLEHAVWGVSWLILSLPFLTALKGWNALRARALAQVSNRPRSLDEGAKRLLDEARPLNDWLVGIAKGGAVVTFVLSLLHAVGQ